jgi:hypothetical protein
MYFWFRGPELLNDDMNNIKTMEIGTMSQPFGQLI